MAYIFVHAGGGCEFVSNSEGNELYDFEVHLDLCVAKPIWSVIFAGRFTKMACEKHAMFWKDRFGSSVTLEPL